MNRNPRILFISHTYPPIVGGVETQNFELFTHISKIADCKLLANKNRKLIPFFLPFSIFYTLFQIHKYDVILLGSGLLGVVGWAVKIFSDKPVIAVAHGLDLTWENKFYQKLWVQYFIPKLDKLIAVGNETICAGEAKKIATDKFIFIPNGVDVDKYFSQPNRKKLNELIGSETENKNVILTSGRLAKRKGVAWFIRNIMPKLSEEFIYIVAGNGPDKENVLNAINETGLTKRVYALGYVTDDVRDMLFSTCDLFVQPNIKIAGDMEGFGISVIEAGACEIPVLASRLEGLKDAIKDNQNGFLVEPENAQEYVEKINELFQDKNKLREFGKKSRQFIVENYSWEIIARKYLEEICKIIN